MTRVLIVYYSQSGEAERAAKAFAEGLESSGATVAFEALRPRTDYPFPWRSPRRFFDNMPESMLALPPEIETPSLEAQARFDLVVIVYPVWFLSPAPVVQGFFRSAHAAVLRDADVITISVSRNMWHNASLRMKQLLAEAGARHRDNIVVTHQGSALLTLVSTPRALLFGKSDRLLGVFPRAGVAEDDMARVRRLGSVAAGRRSAAGVPEGPLLAGEPAVAIKRWFVVPELLAWYFFYAWAQIIRLLGRLHDGLRAIGVYAFAIFLICLILVALPCTLLGTWLVYPAVRRRLDAYIARLAAPTGLP
ncbi:MAG: flavodoxin family protein [Methyloligellaceae bacterium]